MTAMTAEPAFCRGKATLRAPWPAIRTFFYRNYTDYFFGIGYSFRLDALFGGSIGTSP
jgi:hypothetical protein